MPVTLLAVDDSVTMRKVLEMTFAGEDYRVVTADSADTAVSLARSESPALVLADITLPGKTGYDLCQELKRENPNLLVLLLSSKQHPFDPARAQAAQADDHIDKPFDTQQMIDKVRALVSGRPATVQAPARAAASPFRAPAAPAPMAGPARAAPARAPQPASPLSSATRPSQPGVRGTAEFAARSPVAAREPIAARAPVAREPLPAREPAPVAARATAPSVPAVQPVARASTKPAAVAQAIASTGANEVMTSKLAQMGLSKEQIEGVLALSHDVIERVVWEVVPTLAETIIREEIKRLTAD